MKTDAMDRQINEKENRLRGQRRLVRMASEDEFCQGGFKQFSVISNNTDNT